MSDSPRTVRLAVRGRVQGVYYRFSMVHEAVRIGVTGWVRNRSDGSVEAVVQGTPDRIDEMIAWARRGPAAARVAGVEVSEAEGEFATFEVRATE
ncbi:MAG TPA: acylphosphatase [Usitatibacter sp.]|jgi:acylphosphatase